MKDLIPVSKNFQGGENKIKMAQRFLRGPTRRGKTHPNLEHKSTITKDFQLKIRISAMLDKDGLNTFLHLETCWLNTQGSI